MSSPNTNWYSHLVAQSRTGHIYTLIHEYIPFDWQPLHDYDFVIVRLSNLPPGLQSPSAIHISKKLPQPDYCFAHTDYIVLHNYHLTEYLEAAKAAVIVEDAKKRSFIELLFKKETKQTDPLPVAGDLKEEEMNLLLAYELLQKGFNKELALEYAQKGERFLDNNRIETGDSSEETLQKIKRQMTGYNIVAMVYAWNNQMANAAAADAIYIHHPEFWDILEQYIKPYLELLMIKRELGYVKYLFSDKAFRKHFLAHYEAFVSLFIDDTFPLTRPGEVVGIINRVNNAS
ncbi:MAG: hypothetical protein JNL23_10755 [Chitinophagaceae bacterium]|nr:hypothetical protein [Chitinophagaceae bacterium]